MHSYTKGPWVIRDDEVGYISQHDDQSFGMFCPLAIVYENDNAKRIVSCVNALEGLSNDALDGGWNFKSMSKYCKDIESQRNELLEALELLIDDLALRAKLRGDDCLDVSDSRLIKAQEAILKAKGK